MPLGPLSRQQLLDVEGLRRPPQHVVAAHSVLDPFHRHHGGGALGAKSVSDASGGAPLTQQPSPPVKPAAAGGSAGDDSQPLAPKSPALKPANSYSGVQTVDGNDKTLRLRWGWKLHDAALYFTWLACAPLSCSHCGAVAAGFQPDPDGEYRCALCQGTCGGGGRADIVEEIAGENEDRASDDDADDDPDAMMAGAAGGGTGLGTDASVVQTVQFLLVVLRSAGIDVPVTGYPQLLRAAAAIAQLLLLPDCDLEQYSVLRSAALYVACSVLVPAKLPFPALQRVSNCGLQWLDCVAVANAIGTVLEDFFDDPVAHTRNLMADLNPLPTPSSRLWDPARTSHLKADMDALQAVERGERHSPDHTAAIVVLELCRRHPAEARPLLKRWHSALTTSHANKFGTLATRHPQLIFFAETEGEDAEEGQDKTLLSTLLCFFAVHFDMHPVELCRMATASGLFHGRTAADATLQNSLSCGLYPIPLMSRNSPVESPWEPVFRALHSSDRVVLHALVAAIAQGGSSAVHEMPETTKTLQAILAKHGAVSAITVNYCLRVEDDVETAFNGDYFCSSVTPDGASYVHLTKALSVRFRAKTLVVYLNDPETPPAQRRHTTQLKSTIQPPTRLGLEGPSAKLLIDCAANKLGLERWAEAARRLGLRAALRRRMRANASHLARAATLLSADVTFSRGPSDAASTTTALALLRDPPTLESSYATCDLVRDVPALHAHLAASDTTIAAAAAALQHVVEQIPGAPGSPPHGAAVPAAVTPPRASPKQRQNGGGNGVPPLQLPPAAADAEAAAAQTNGHRRQGSSAAAAKSWRQIGQLSFGLDAARELRPLVQQAAGAIAKLRRSRADGATGAAEEFVSDLEAARATPRQPRPLGF